MAAGGKVPDGVEHGLHCHTAGRTVGIWCFFVGTEFRRAAVDHGGVVSRDCEAVFAAEVVIPFPADVTLNGFHGFFSICRRSSVLLGATLFVRKPLVNLPASFQRSRAGCKLVAAEPFFKSVASVLTYLCLVVWMRAFAGASFCLKGMACVLSGVLAGWLPRHIGG